VKNLSLNEIIEKMVNVHIERGHILMEIEDYKELKILIDNLVVCNDCNPFSHWEELSEEEINEVNALISSLR
jgi:hypothetical protein